MRLFGWKKRRSSVPVAKERLQAILASDRVNCTPEQVGHISEDLFEAVSKYLEITPDNFQVEITKSDIHIKLAGEKE